MSQSETFASRPSTQREILALVNSLADLCSAIAAEKGFRDDEIAVAAALHASAVGGQLPAQALAWLASTALQAEIARAHSELSEALEGARKPHADAHCPDHDNLVVELADALIQAGTTPLEAKMATWDYLVERDEKTPIDSTPPPARPKAVRRAEFKKMSPTEQRALILSGAQLID